MTRHEDAELAVELGAWAIGFVLWPHSPRAADPAVAAGIAAALRRRVELVGVFVNATFDEIAHAADELHLSHVQLHGDEGPAFCAEVARRTGAKVIKAMRISSASDFQDLARFHTDFHLLDTARRGPYGGQYVPETLMPALAELEAAWLVAREDADYRDGLARLQRDYCGRPTP